MTTSKFVLEDENLAVAYDDVSDFKEKLSEAEKLFEDLDDYRSQMFKISQTRKDYKTHIYHELRYLKGYEKRIVWNRIYVEHLELARDISSFRPMRPRPRTITFLDDSHFGTNFQSGHYATQLSLFWSNNRYKSKLQRKKNGMEYLQQAEEVLLNMEELKQTACNVVPEYEVNKIVRSLTFGIKHGKKNRSNEKRLLRQLEHAKATRTKISSEDLSGNYMVGWLKKDFDKEQKILSDDMDELRKSQIEYNSYLKHLLAELKYVENEFSTMDKEQDINYRKRMEARESLENLKNERMKLVQAIAHVDV